MSRYSSTMVTKATLRPLLTGALSAVLASPLPAAAFFQSTKLEGTIGSDIGGVWLSVQQVMPEFRINYPKPAGGKAVPVEAGPIPSRPPRILCVLRVKALVFPYLSSGTIQKAFCPRATRSQLSKALRQRFQWLSQVGPAACGLKIAFCSLNS